MEKDKPAGSEPDPTTEWNADQGLELHRLIARRPSKSERKRRDSEGATHDPQRKDD